MKEHLFVGADDEECMTCHLPRRNRHHLPESAAPAPLPDVEQGGHPVSAGHPETGRALAAVPGFGSAQRRVLDCIGGAKHFGRTDDEIEIETGRSHQTISAARYALAHKGWIVRLFEDGKPVTRETRYGNQAQVWVLSENAAERWMS